uniref:Lipocalin n=1 Tax=Rhipicephalus appendiculatus TaxID=34631 RepID=A0A131YQ10_RHIAP
MRMRHICKLCIGAFIFHRNCFREALTRYYLTGRFCSRSMNGNRLFVFLLFASHLSTLECRFGAIKHGLSGRQEGIRAGKYRRRNSTQCKYDGIAQFLCTEEPIWLYNSSARTDRQCEVDQKESMSHVSIMFRRSYYSSRTKISGDIEGTFDPRDDRRMYIEVPSTAKAIVPKITEEMMYMSKKLRCAVFKYTTVPGRGITYDLRVRNSSITRGPSNGCIKKFDNLAKNYFAVYQPNCQNILLEKTKPKFTINGKEKPKNEHLR